MKKSMLIISVLALFCEMITCVNLVQASHIGSSTLEKEINWKVTRPATVSEEDDYEVEEYIVCVSKTRVWLEGGIVYTPETTSVPRELYKNDVVFVRKIEKGWAQIRLSVGWARVAAKDLRKFKEGTASPRRLLTKKYIVKVNRTTIRKGSGSYFPSDGHLCKNDIVNVRRIRNGWAKFKLRGKWRYVKAKHLKKCKH